MKSHVLLVQDCLAGLRELSADSIDSVVTDPPYGLSFMGRKWDHGVPSVEIWQDVYRVLKPGGHLLSFGGSRTYHRMASAIEDAGFEIRDQIMWIYGSGFPKSLDVSKALDVAAGKTREVSGRYTRPDGSAPRDNVSATKYSGRCLNGGKASGNGNDGNVTAPVTSEAKQWQGFGTALKPAHEPIVLARKPLSEATVARNVLKHGTGAINIDGCRISVHDAQYTKNCSGDRGHSANRSREMNFGMTAGNANSLGRWPANVMHDGSDEVVAHFPQQKSGANPTRRKSDKFQTTYSEFEGKTDCIQHRGTDAGSAARFFYCAKASKRERGEDNTHPTVKPIALMEYLVRLITPPGGTVLDPFTGSGTTAIAAMHTGFSFIGFEREREYAKIARHRMTNALKKAA